MAKFSLAEAQSCAWEKEVYVKDRWCFAVRDPQTLLTYYWEDAILPENADKEARNAVRDAYLRSINRDGIDNGGIQKIINDIQTRINDNPFSISGKQYTPIKDMGCSTKDNGHYDIAFNSIFQHNYYNADCDFALFYDGNQVGAEIKISSLGPYKYMVHLLGSIPEALAGKKIEIRAKTEIGVMTLLDKTLQVWGYK